MYGPHWVVSYACSSPRVLQLAHATYDPQVFGAGNVEPVEALDVSRTHLSVTPRIHAAMFFDRFDIKTRELTQIDLCD